jgi:MFS family permease
MLSSICETYLPLLVTHGIVFGFASGMIFTPTVSVVGQYFTSKRASATGIAVSGASVGGVVFPLVLDRLFNASSFGFGASVRILGGVMAVLLTFTAVVTHEFAPRRKRRLVLPQAFHESAYIWLLLGFFFTLLGFWTPIFYIVEYAQSKGIDAVTAFYLVAIMNATSFLGRVFLSILADKMGRFNANAVFTACTSVLILTWTAADTKTAITVWISFYGFFQSAVMLLISPCLAQISPRPSDIGTYVGMALAGGSIGGLLDTPLNGALISRFGYFPASVLSGFLVLVGAVCYTIARLRLDRRLWAKL